MTHRAAGFPDIDDDDDDDGDDGETDDVVYRSLMSPTTTKRS